VRVLVSQKINESDQGKVLFFKPEEVFSYLEKEAALEAEKEERIKGYRVKVRFQPVKEEDKRTKREAVAKVILQAMRRLKQKKN
ncbi:hypothetical protein J7J59_00265, partial [Candidatus Aerophobetes bacterium]|nr:hypothetical protein [Candidatus Aerophobetes bacterium]